MPNNTGVEAVIGEVHAEARSKAVDQSPHPPSRHQLKQPNAEKFKNCRPGWNDQKDRNHEFVKVYGVLRIILRLEMHARWDGPASSRRTQEKIQPWIFQSLGAEYSAMMRKCKELILFQVGDSEKSRLTDKLTVISRQLSKRIISLSW